MFSQPGNSQTPITRVGIGFALLSVASLTGCAAFGPKPVEKTTPTPLPEPSRNSMTTPTPEPSPSFDGMPLDENCRPLNLPENSYEVCAAIVRDPDQPGHVVDIVGNFRSTDDRSIDLGNVKVTTYLQAFPLGKNVSPVVSKTNESGSYSEQFIYKVDCPDERFLNSDKFTAGVNYEVHGESGQGVLILEKADTVDLSSLCLLPTASPTPTPRASSSFGIGS